MQFYNFNGSFLIPNTIYYARAYATNNAGASYSNEIQIVAAVPQIGDYDYSGGIVISVDSGTRQYVVMSLRGWSALNWSLAMSTCDNFTDFFLHYSLFIQFVRN